MNADLHEDLSRVFSGHCNVQKGVSFKKDTHRFSMYGTCIINMHYLINGVLLETRPLFLLPRSHKEQKYPRVSIRIRPRNQISI